MIAGIRPEGGGSIAGFPTDVRLMHPWIYPSKSAVICDFNFQPCTYFSRIQVLAPLFRNLAILVINLLSN